MARLIASKGIAVRHVAFSLAVGWLLVWNAIPEEGGKPEVEQFDVPVKSWSGTNRWQRAPSGPGEYVPFPEHAATLQVNGRRFLGTPLGLLERKPDATWEIVHETYLRSIRPIKALGDVLWAVEGKELVAFDPADWSVKSRSAIPDGARVVDVETEGFWCLENRRTVYGEVGRTGYQVLTRYDLRGVCQFRFETRQGKPLRFTPQGNLIPEKKPAVKPGEDPSLEGLIYWATIEEDAVWLAVVDFKGIRPNDAPVYGSRKLVRIDRQTGKHSDADVYLWAGTPLVSVPGAVLWLMPKTNTVWTVNRLDKKTMAVTKPADLSVSYSHDLATDGKNLWVYDWKPNVFTLDGFKPVPLDKVGQHELTARHPGNHPYLQLLSGDSERAWLSAPPCLVVELPDNGAARARDLSCWFKSNRYICSQAALPGALYLPATGMLLRIPAGAGQVTARRGAYGNSYPPLLTAGNELVWIQASYQGEVAKLAPDLSGLEVVTTDRADLNRHRIRGGFADGKFLYVYGGNPTMLARLDSRNGTIKPVESWGEQCAKWWRKIHGREPLPQDLGRFMHHSPKRDPETGRLRFIQHMSYPQKKGAPLRSVSMLWIYDPKTGDWRDAVLPDGVAAVTYSDLFYRQETGEMLRYRKGKWEVVARMPKQWYPGNFRYWRVATTTRYLYARTPLGLFRATWDELKPK